MTTRVCCANLSQYIHIYTDLYSAMSFGSMGQVDDIEVHRGLPASNDDYCCMACEQWWEVDPEDLHACSCYRAVSFVCSFRCYECSPPVPLCCACERAHFARVHVFGAMEQLRRCFAAWAHTERQPNSLARSASAPGFITACREPEEELAEPLGGGNW